MICRKMQHTLAVVTKKWKKNVLIEVINTHRLSDSKFYKLQAAVGADFLLLYLRVQEEDEEEKEEEAV